MMRFSQITIWLGMLAITFSEGAFSQTNAENLSEYSTGWVCSFGDSNAVISGRSTPPKHLFVGMSDTMKGQEKRQFFQTDPQQLLGASEVNDFRSGDGKQVRHILLTSSKALVVLQKPGQHGGNVSFIAKRSDLAKGPEATEFTGFCMEMVEEMSLEEMKTLGNEILSEASAR